MSLECWDSLLQSHKIYSNQHSSLDSTAAHRSVHCYQFDNRYRRGRHSHTLPMFLLPKLAKGNTAHRCYWSYRQSKMDQLNSFEHTGYRHCHSKSRLASSDKLTNINITRRAILGGIITVVSRGTCLITEGVLVLQVSDEEFR
jgi:hypothetical protein